MTRRGTASIVASPVLVGAVTVLIIIVSVFLAYNANQGLPFVPTYNLRAELPSGANLVAGNEVRVGGFRVGVVDAIDTQTITRDGETRAIAVLDMNLDKTIEPLATDTEVLVRPRSALGLKYVELTPGFAPSTYAAGDTIPLANSGEPVEFDDFLNTFDAPLREDSRRALTGYGDALAGRGQSINIALGELPEFFTSLTSVMDNLNDEDTELDQFFVQIGRASAQVAPVADVQARLFTKMADTFAAFSQDPRALQETIEGAPPTLDEGIQSFPVQRPFLADFAELSDRLRPAAQELPRSLPDVNTALTVGQDALPRTVTFNNQLENVFESIDELAEDPNTGLALDDLIVTTRAGAGFFGGVAPYQTVCNAATYFLVPLGSHISEKVPGGTIQRVLVRTTNREQDNSLNQFLDSDRPADVPASVDPQEAEDPAGNSFDVLHGQPYQPAIDRQGNADCQNGQNGYLDGPTNLPGLYPLPGDSDTFNDVEDLEDSVPDTGGGFHTVTKPNFGPNDAYPGNNGRAGPTFDPNSPDGLGVENVDEVK